MSALDVVAIGGISFFIIVVSVIMAYYFLKRSQSDN